MTARLPHSCAGCVFFLAAPAANGKTPPTTGTCLRHAPATGPDQYELVFWSIVSQFDRCGMGAAVGDEAPEVVVCDICIHWYQPDGQPIKPDYRKGHSVEFWQETGYCTRFAPSPSSEEDRRVYPKVVHRMNGCGDGQAISLEGDDG